MSAYFSAAPLGPYFGQADKACAVGRNADLVRALKCGES